MAERKHKMYSLSEITEFPGNYNKHPDKQVAALVSSLEKFGQTKNVVIWKDRVVCGNGLVMAARRLGWDEIRGVDVSDLNEKKAKALLIADNKTAEMSEPDEDMLADLIVDIDFEIPGLAIDDPIGFDGDDNAGASPWDRIGEKDTETVLFSFGEIVCNIPIDIYSNFKEKISQSENIQEAVAGVLV